MNQAAETCRVIRYGFRQSIYEMHNFTFSFSKSTRFMGFINFIRHNHHISYLLAFCCSSSHTSTPSSQLNVSVNLLKSMRFAANIDTVQLQCK